MPFAPCRRCNGSGRYSDQNPVVPGEFRWCAGCGGDGQVNVVDPEVECGRCRGRGRYRDPNPTKPASHNWCLACKGTGYAS